MIYLFKNFNYLLFLVLVACIACNKEKPDMVTPVPIPPQSTPHRIKARVVEYGSDLPIAGAMVEIVAFPLTFLNQITNEHGECWFTANEFTFGKFSEPKHWDFIMNHQPISSLELFPANGSIDYFGGKTYSCDSFVLKMFPITYMTIHLKDSLLLPLLYPDNKMIFSVSGSFIASGKEYFIYSGSGRDQDGAIITLRHGIDTVFQYPVFGNTDNLFNVGEDDSFDGWPGFLNFIHQETKYIAKGSDERLNITF